MGLSEKVVIITGAARGLGQTYARRFAELGAHLVVCDLRDCAETVARCRQAGGGTIINISSLAAVYGMPNGLHYTTSKAAVIGLTRGLAREVGRYNIRVNAVAPNVVDTQAAGEFFGDKKDKLMQATTSQMSLRKPVQADDLFGTILYLASDQSCCTTGQTLMVDGGTVFL